VGSGLFTIWVGMGGGMAGGTCPNAITDGRNANDESIKKPQIIKAANFFMSLVFGFR
jgi:hypothetical protein